MGISFSTQEDSGFDSSSSLQPLLEISTQAAALCPGCPLKWVPADGKKTMGMGCYHAYSGSGEGERENHIFEELFQQDCFISDYIRDVSPSCRWLQEDQALWKEDSLIFIFISSPLQIYGLLVWVRVVAGLHTCSCRALVAVTCCQPGFYLYFIGGTLSHL